MQDINNMMNAFGEADDSFRDNVYHTLTRLPKVVTYTKARRPVIVIAACFVLVFAMSVTAFAYGGEILNAIKSFMFGDSSATQVEYIEDRIVSMVIVNRSELVDHDKGTGLVHYDSLEEANRYVPFTVKVPSYLPDNVIGFSHPIIAQRKLDGTAGYDVFIQYKVDDPDNIDELNLMNIDQYYIGPNAYIELETIAPIQKVMVGDVEALLVSTEGYLDYVQFFLYWIKDDILYEVINGCYDLETIITIAESVHLQ